MKYDQHANRNRAQDAIALHAGNGQQPDHPLGVQLERHGPELSVDDIRLGIVLKHAWKKIVDLTNRVEQVEEE